MIEREIQKQRQLQAQKQEDSDSYYDSEEDEQTTKPPAKAQPTPKNDDVFDKLGKNFQELKKKITGTEDPKK